LEQQYFLARRQLELDAALRAQCTEARMIHLDLAARYSLKATEAADEARMDKLHDGIEDARLRFVA
jgi:hypothetical protein